GASRTFPRARPPRCPSTCQASSRRRRRASPLPGKQEIRDRVWTLLTERRVGRFPLPLRDRIPNFAGAEQAARRLTELPEWRAARRIKCNPHAPPRALRLAALRAGKPRVLAAPPRRARQEPRGKLAQAATISGASKLGVAVSPAKIGRIDLVVAGSVAVDEKGARVGKGGGYSDLEFALARSLELVDDDTPVVTTVHELQVVDETIPMTAHDVPLDIVVTPERVIRTGRRHRRPTAIVWSELSDAQLPDMPALARIAPAQSRRSRARS